MSPEQSPAMSVVLLTPDCYETVRTTIRHLRAQTVAGQLEVVIVAPSAEKLGMPEVARTGFLRVRVIEVAALQSSGQARAVGVLAASAPLVAFTEDHAFPEPGWAEALIAAHRQPWAAVGPVLANANPASMVSWADMLLAYAPWLEPAPARVCEHLPGHNGSYKRAILLAYGPQLAAMLESETALHWDLRAWGYQLYLEPAAKTVHLNFSRLSSFLLVQFRAGRVLAGSRARDWSWPRRVLYTGGAPLIPLVRLLRVLGELGRPGRPRCLLPQVLPVLLAGLVASAAGELIGYARGVGRGLLQLSELEFHRERHLSQQDRRALV